MIAVVAPHARCFRARAPTISGRRTRVVYEQVRCDRRAAETALRLGRELNQGPYGFRRAATVMIPRTVRAECDLNRKAARPHPYRRLLRAMAVAGHLRLVVDVHSFTSNKGRTGSAAGNRPFVLLDSPPPGTPLLTDASSAPELIEPGDRMTVSTASLKAGLEASGWKNVPVFRSALGDVRQEMLELGVPVVSIEVGDRLPAAHLPILVRHIAQWALRPRRNFPFPSR